MVELGLDINLVQARPEEKVLDDEGTDFLVLDEVIKSSIALRKIS